MKLWPFGVKKPVPATAYDDLPIPTYLKQYFVPAHEKCNMSEVTGSICCTCGGRAFKALHSEDIDFLFSLTCVSCGQDVLLFDAKQHGWDAVVCGLVPKETVTAECTEKCAKCGSEEFHADVWIEACNREEFVEDVPDDLTEDDWVNAYGWFGAHLTCAHCGHRVRDWADVETA